MVKVQNGAGTKWDQLKVGSGRNYTRAWLGRNLESDRGERNLCGRNRLGQFVVL